MPYIRMEVWLLEDIQLSNLPMHSIVCDLSFRAFKCETAWRALLSKVASRPLLATSVNNEGAGLTW